VRRYLRDFLMDRFVVDVPWPIRWLIVHGFILPFRPRRSADAYAKIWDAAGPGSGSPLLHYSRRFAEAVDVELDAPCELAMRYGEPSLQSAIARLRAAGVDEVLLAPLYPQFADSTRTTTEVEVRRLLGDDVRLEVLPPFYDRPGYIDALVTSVRDVLPERWDHLLLSFHGVPERHITRADPTGSHCLASADCCRTPSPAHATCYRHQCLRTAQEMAAGLGFGEDRYSVSFQSRLGRLPWLQPYTDHVLAELPGRGVEHLVVACPAFVADNLETIEEVGMAGRETFLAAGGKTFTLAPCLNDRADWVRAFNEWCAPFAGRAA
jgi:ferrochelatase